MSGESVVINVHLCPDDKTLFSEPLRHICIKLKVKRYEVKVLSSEVERAHPLHDKLEDFR